jgi:hypothetical protein
MYHIIKIDEDLYIGCYSSYEEALKTLEYLRKGSENSMYILTKDTLD